MSLYEILTIVVTILGAWMAYIEKRFAGLKHIIDEKVIQQEKINNIVTSELKDDVKRLEQKIDKLIDYHLNKDN